MSKRIKVIINTLFALVIALCSYALGMRYDNIKHTKLLRETTKTLSFKEDAKKETDAYMEEIYRMGIRDGVYSTLQVPYDRLDQACYDFLLYHNINPSYSTFYDRFQSEWFSFLQENGYCEAYPCEEINIDSIDNRLNY